MLDTETKRRIDSARDILVGKVPDPKSQVEQITIALIYKFMDDMDLESEELGGERSFFNGEFEKYAWHKIFDPRMGGFEILSLYTEAIMKMNVNPNIPQLFRDIFKNAYLPYRDPETLKAFLKVINDFNYDHSEKLGDAFEYLLSVLGSQGDAGQFRTPRHIIDFMVAIIDPKKEEVIMDPACGTAGFLISSYKHIIKHNSTNYDPATDIRTFETKDQNLSELIINSKNYKGDNLTPDENERLAKNIRGYDISPDMVRLSLVNMYLHGLHAPRISEYDTLTSEDNWNEYADVILANPPFMSPKGGGIRPHKRFSITSNRSEVLFVDYITEHLNPNGRAAVIVPEGIIFQSGKAYQSLRKKLVDEYLVGVISLPAGVFQPYSGVKTSILWLDKNLAKKIDNLLFVKIENDGFDLGAQRRLIKQNDLPRLEREVTTYKRALLGGGDYEPISENLALVSKERIRESGAYNLSAKRYIDEILLTSDFPIVTLGDYISINNGRVLSDFDDTKIIPCIKVSDMNLIENQREIVTSSHWLEKTKFSLLPINSIVFPKRGAAIATNKKRIIKIPCLIDNNCMGVSITKPDILDYRYLYSLLEDFDLSTISNSAGIPLINNPDISNIKIPLPPLSIQEEIVAEIENYQKIIDGARQVVENYKPRIDFDPVWDMVELREVIDSLEAGVSVNSENIQKKDGEIGVLKTSSVTYGDFRPWAHKTVLPSEYPRLKCNPKKNSIIISRMNTENLVGASAYVDENYDDIYLPDRLWQTTITKPSISPQYIHLVISSEVYRKKISEICGGTSGSMKNISKKNFLSILIPLPNIEVQKEIVSAIESEKVLINSTKQLIKAFEQKIKDRIAKVWGDK